MGKEEHILQWLEREMHLQCWSEDMKGRIPVARFRPWWDCNIKNRASRCELDPAGSRERDDEP